MTQTAPTPAPLDDILDIVRTIVVALLLALVLRIVLFQPFTIPSSSMEPGLVIGDYVIVSKFAYGWSPASLPLNLPMGHGRLFGRDPKRGDVVVFRRPSEPETPWVKRVIGLPGDRVQVLNGTVFVNGRQIAQSHVRETMDHDAPGRPVAEVRETLDSGRTWVTYDDEQHGPGDDTPVFEVPAGFYFMMGDNRDNSLDSRWPAETGVGLLPAANIVGKAEIVAASWKPGAGLIKPWTWLNLQWDRFLRPVH